MKYHNLIQQTDEWFALKIANPFSASNAQAIATAGKGLETLIWDSLVKKYSSQIEKRFSTIHTERGNELEPQARAIYELINDLIVKEVGFITNDKISILAGVSPDGLVGEKGMLEIKAINDKAYLQKLHENKIKGEFKVDSSHEWQCQMQMLFAEREWNDYMIYNPNFEIDYLIKRIDKDLVKHEKLKTGLVIGVKLYKTYDEVMQQILKIN